MDLIMRSFYDENEKVWSGLKAMPMFHENCSIGRIIYTALKTYPNNVCQINAVDGESITNQQMLNWSIRIAQQLQKRNIGRDDVIGIISKNCTYQTAVAVGGFFNATPFHAINPAHSPNTLTHILAITKPKIIFCESDDLERIKEVSSTWERELITLTGKVNGVTSVEDLLEPTQTEFYFQIYTSEVVTFSYSGLDWSSGLIQMLLSMAIGCTRIITNRPHNTKDLVEMIEKYKMNAVVLAARQVSELVDYPLVNSERLASLRSVLIGGSSLSTRTLVKMEQLAKSALLYFVYGTTESGAVTASFSTKKFGNTVGKLIPGTRVRIVSDEGVNLGPKDIGEIYIHNGHQQWLGYYGNPLQTQKTFDSESWFHTGDLGYFDEDNNLYIVDRKKDIFKCKGFHYWPSQIEDVIAEMPDVQEVCVVGIYDERIGDAPAAMVVPRKGALIDEDHIKQHVANVLVADYLQLHGGVYFADALPQNNNDKIIRREVKEAIIKAKQSVK